MLVAGSKGYEEGEMGNWNVVRRVLVMVSVLAVFAVLPAVASAADPPPPLCPSGSVGVWNAIDVDLLTSKGALVGVVHVQYKDGSGGDDPGVHLTFYDPSGEAAIIRVALDVEAVLGDIPTKKNGKAIFKDFEQGFLDKDGAPGGVPFVNQEYVDGNHPFTFYIAARVVMKAPVFDSGGGVLEYKRVVTWATNEPWKKWAHFEYEATLETCVPVTS